MYSYKVGDDVRVEFIGTITGISLGLDKKPRYKVEGGVYEATGLFLKADNICSLLMPEDLKVKEEVRNAKD